MLKLGKKLNFEGFLRKERKYFRSDIFEMKK
jgi:hypothetical protein